jgi:hypothetical protein
VCRGASHGGVHQGVLEKVWKDKISFVKLDLENPESVPVNPGTVLNDDVSFEKAN